MHFEVLSTTSIVLCPLICAIECTIYSQKSGIPKNPAGQKPAKKPTIVRLR